MEQKTNYMRIGKRGDRGRLLPRSGETLETITVSVSAEFVLLLQKQLTESETKSEYIANLLRQELKAGLPSIEYLYYLSDKLSSADRVLISSRVFEADKQALQNKLAALEDLPKFQKTISAYLRTALYRTIAPDYFKSKLKYTTLTNITFLAPNHLIERVNSSRTNKTLSSYISQLIEDEVNNGLPSLELLHNYPDLDTTDTRVLTSRIQAKHKDIINEELSKLTTVKKSNKTLSAFARFLLYKNLKDDSK